MIKSTPYWLTIVGLILASYAIDSIIGPLDLPIRQPYAFLGASYLSTYPLTAISIIAKAISVTMTVNALISLIIDNHYHRVIVFVILGSLVQLFAIQQLMTHRLVAPITWVIGSAYGGTLLIVPTLINILAAIAKTATHTLIKEAGLPMPPETKQ